MTLTLDSNARALWQDYKSRVRAALSSLPADEVGDIIDDLEQHLEFAAADHSDRLNASEVETIILELGSPELIAQNAGLDSAVASNAPHSIHIGLAYFSLAILILALLPSIYSLALLIISGVCARVALQRPAVLLNQARFALLPGLLINYLLLGLLIFLWPLALVLPAAATGGLLEIVTPGLAEFRNSGAGAYWMIAWSLGALCTGLWLFVLSRCARLTDTVFSVLFFPYWTDQQAQLKRLGAGGASALLLVSLAVLIYALVIF